MYFSVFLHDVTSIVGVNKIKFHITVSKYIMSD